MTSYWHGINAVALLAYAERESLAVEGLSDPGELARNAAADVLVTVKGLTGPWELATACEAHIARDEIEDALGRAREFVENKETDAFMIASFLRQVLTVWQPKPESVLGTTLLPLLRSALVSKTGGSVTLNSNDLAATRIEQLEQLETGDHETGLQLEKVFGPDRFQTLRWWRNGLTRCRAVVRIDDLNGVGRGTGFLIKGSDLHPSLPALVVITNCHVVPDAVKPTRRQGGLSRPGRRLRGPEDVRRQTDMVALAAQPTRRGYGGAGAQRRAQTRSSRSPWQTRSRRSTTPRGPTSSATRGATTSRSSPFRTICCSSTTTPICTTGHRPKAAVRAARSSKASGR